MPQKPKVNYGNFYLLLLNIYIGDIKANLDAVVLFFLGVSEFGHDG